MHFLRLIRFPNQVIILLTQAILYFGLIYPLLSRNNISPVLEKGHFYLIFIITSLISISGYIINDILDVRTDLINKEKKMVIAKKISLPTARILYVVVVIAGFIITWCTANHYDVLAYLFLYPALVALLAFYSFSLKGTILLGNIVVAFLSAAVNVILPIIEKGALLQLREKSFTDFQLIFSIILAFSIFAFLSSLFREIVKDIEDMEGDKSQEIKTMAVRWGRHTADKVGTGIASLLAATILYWIFIWPNNLHTGFQIFGIFILIFLIFCIIKQLISKTKKDYHQLSLMIKGLMFAGLLYLLLYVYLLNQIKLIL